MDYTQASKRFDIDKFVTRITEENYFDLLDKLNREIREVENLTIPSKNLYKRDIEYLQTSYLSDLKGLSFLLVQRIKPGGVNVGTLLKFKPILEALVKKGQIKETILKLIE